VTIRAGVLKEASDRFIAFLAVSCVAAKEQIMPVDGGACASYREVYLYAGCGDLGSCNLMRSYFVSAGRLRSSRVASLFLPLLLVTSASIAFSETGSISAAVVNSAGSANNLLASYAVEAANPVPVVGNSSPTEAAAGSTVPVTFSGQGFLSSTVILVNGNAVPTTYKSSTSILAKRKIPRQGVEPARPSPCGWNASRCRPSIPMEPTPAPRASPCR
jgi:hypothetical protein